MVKARAPYRPYALSLNFEEANNLLIDFDPELIPFRWMQLVCDVKPHQRDRVCSALHIDGSTRPQVVFPGDNQPFHQLLAQYGDLSGTAALLNTSFNESGYPIVTTAIEALAMFSRTGMDILVIENTMIEKIWETGSNAN
jgi:predicted NodU family carbamoyl transferase